MIDYQYLDDRPKWPAETRAPNNAGTVPGVRVVWTGRVTPRDSGLHRFRLYSSPYVKVFVDGREVLERWRQNWNPWYHNFDLELAAGRAADMRIEWEPNSGYIALLHNDPRPEADRHSLTLSSEARPRRSTIISSPARHGRGHRRLSRADRPAPMMPRWAYGFWQSRQRYETQDATARRAPRISPPRPPDRHYRPGLVLLAREQLGQPRLRSGALPRPAGMVDEVHRLNARIMISVWPKFYPTTDNYRELDAVGGIHRRQVEPARRADRPRYIRHVPRLGRPRLCQRLLRSLRRRSARDLYWRQISETLVANRASTPGGSIPTSPTSTPTSRSRSALRRMSPTAPGPGAAMFNSYPLVHVEGVYDNLRRVPAGHAAVHPHPLGLRRHPARRRRALVGRRRRALGRSARPDLGRGQFLDVGHAQLDPRHRRLRARGALPAPGPGPCRGMARTEPALVPVRRLLAPVPQPWRVAAPRDLRDRAGRLGHVRGRWNITTGSATGCCPTSTRSPPTPGTATAR